MLLFFFFCSAKFNAGSDQGKNNVKEQQRQDSLCETVPQVQYLLNN